MLRELRVRRFAVSEEATVPFSPGPNVLLSDSDSAAVEAVFEVEPAGSVCRIIAELGHQPEDGQVIIRRELSRSGKSRAFVNDVTATLGLLERLGDHLVEIHGQHEHQLLLEPARQLELLDRFAGVERAREEVATLVARWEQAKGELERLAT